MSEQRGWKESILEFLTMAQRAAVNTPVAGHARLYIDSASHLHVVDASGVDIDVNSGGGTEYDPVDTGMSAEDVQAALDELAAQIAAVGQPPTAPARGTYRVAGGNLVYTGSGYVYTITAGSGYIDGVIINWTQQNVTLEAADATNNRIDVFVVNAAGTVSAIKGTAATTPSKPDVDPALYLELTFALVYANTATPTGTSTTSVYAENAGTPTEWGSATSNAGTVALASTTDPRGGTKCIRASSATAGTTITLTAAAAIDPTTASVFALYIKLLSSWGNRASLTLQFYLSTVKKGNAVTIKPGENGLIATNLTTYQGQAFLIQQFGFAPGTTVDKLVITVTGATCSFALDDIQLQTFAGVTVVPSTGLTQADADARYAPISSQIRTANLIIDGGGSAITTGIKLRWKVDFNCTILSWTLLADAGGAIKIDLWRSTYANYNPGTHPVDADSICGGHEPEIAATNYKAVDTDLSDWTSVALVAGDCIFVNVDSCTTIAFADLALKLRVN